MGEQPHLIQLAEKSAIGPLEVPHSGTSGTGLTDSPASTLWPWNRSPMADWERNVSGEDSEPRIIHSWPEKEYWKIQARMILLTMLGGLVLIWIGIERCVSYPFSRWPLTFLSGFIPIVGGIGLVAMGCFGIRRRHRERRRPPETSH
jgi:hypothetical protein